MENIFDKDLPANYHLMIARAGSELALSHYDYHVIKNDMSRRALSLVDYDFIEINQAQVQSKAESLNNSNLTPNMCQIISIEALRLNRELRTKDMKWDITEGVFYHGEMENSLEISDGENESKNTQDTEISEATRLADRLKELNPTVRFNVKIDDLGERIISSLDIDMLRLPADYQPGRGLDIEVKKTSTIDAFYSDDIIMDEDFLRNMYSEKINLSAVEDIDFIGYEVDKSDRQIEQINSVIRRINAERVERGQDELYIDHNFFRIIKKDVWEKHRPGEAGAYEMQQQCIYMPETENEIVLLIVSNHEGDHADGCNSLGLINGRHEVRQTGIEQMKGFGMDCKPHFRMVNEAVTQTRALRRSEEMLVDDPAYADKLAEAKLVREKWAKDSNLGDEYDADLFAGMDNLLALAENDHEVKMHIYGNAPERRIFNKMTALLSKYSGQSSEVIFDMFVDVAKLNDKSSITNLMERSLGRGAFEKLGKKSMTPKSFEKFVSRVPLMKKVNDVKEFAHNVVDKIRNIFKKKKLA